MLATYGYLLIADIQSASNNCKPFSVKIWLYIPSKTLGGIVQILAPYSNALPTSLTPLIEAPNISVSFQFCFAYTLAISLMRHKPPKELSSTLPTNGETYLAPALAERIA